MIQRLLSYHAESEKPRNLCLKNTKTQLIRNQSISICTLTKQHCLITPLQFWKVNQTSFPILSKLRWKIHCIPAASAAVERQSSSAGFVLNERRISINRDRYIIFYLFELWKKNITKRLSNILKLFLLYLYTYCFFLSITFSVLLCCYFNCKKLG